MQLCKVIYEITVKYIFFMLATNSILCMFIRVDDVIYVEMQFDHSKLCNLISS